MRMSASPGDFIYFVDVFDNNYEFTNDIPTNILAWCVENLDGKKHGVDWDYVGGFNPTRWGFTDEADAMAFKLRWME